MFGSRSLFAQTKDGHFLTFGFTLDRFPPSPLRSYSQKGSNNEERYTVSSPERLNKRPYQTLQIIVRVNCRGMKVLCVAAALLKQDKEHTNVMNLSFRTFSLENMITFLK